MMSNQWAALAASAVMVAVLAACSDSTTTEPTSRAAFVPKSSFVVGATTNNTPVVGVLKICKTGDVGGTFVTTDIGDGQGGTGNPSIASPLAVATGECRIAAEDNGDANQTKGDFFSVSENAAANTTQTLVSCVGVEGQIACNNNYFVNNVHGVVLTFSNVTVPPPPPETCDFSTFGGFVLLPNNISYGGNAGRIEDPPGFAFGDLNFVNHTNGDHIHVWNVTDYGHPDTGPLSEFEDSRLAFGLGSINGGPVNVPVEFRFLDSGEPAKKDGDMVYLKVGDDVLITAQVVGGGNIQLHDKHCKKAPKAEKH
jgi:hypothetical protein